MDKQTVCRLIEANMHKLYAWSMAKLGNKNEAEDMTQDIICALLKSAHRLEKDGAFYGYMWKIARNTLYMKIRSRKETLPLDDAYMGAYVETPEDKAVDREQVALLHRELSLLSRQYREVTVEFYIYGKGCDEISQKLGLSREMVKYCLFKSRKILKEGINMTRELGEKSYAPAEFQIDYWGHGSNGIYRQIFSRRLPGNILLAAYEKPLTVTELSSCLGVAAPYLEDELDVLERHELVTKSKDKYRTNIIIFFDEYEKRVKEETKPFYSAAAESIGKMLEQAAAEAGKLDFYDKPQDVNRLKWTLAAAAFHNARDSFAEKIGEKFGGFPLLSNNAAGFLFGHDNNFVNSGFNGVYVISDEDSPYAAEGAWIVIENYKTIHGCQNWHPGGNWDKSVKAMTDAVKFKKADEDNEEIIRMTKDGYIVSKNGDLCPAFPVFPEKTFQQLSAIIAPVSNETEECTRKICEHAHKLLKDCSPAALADKCGHLAYINYHLDTSAFIVNSLVEAGYLTVPEGRANLCIFGVSNS
ncbi:MAG: sigma-70 family RNA polymerase sigma factor [Ruminococcus sp.]|nr:sigma-70 family RNA polymerase sigma factor [Ruminococcus sp.]